MNFKQHILKVQEQTALLTTIECNEFSQLIATKKSLPHFLKLFKGDDDSMIRGRPLPMKLQRSK